MAYQSELEKLQNRYNENPDQWFAALADQYRKAGSMDLALQVVRTGIEKRPNYVSGHIVLARCYLDQKKDADASAVLQRVLELDAENIMALKTLAEIAHRTEDVGAERGWLSRLLEIDPQNDEAREAMEKLPADGAPAPAPVAAQAPAKPAAAGAVEGFEATSFADLAPAAKAEPVVVEQEPASALEAGASAPMPALEIERTDMSESAPVQMAPLDLEPAGTDLAVVPSPAPNDSMPPVEREELVSLEAAPPEPAPDLLPVDASAAGGDAALGLEPVPMMDLEPMALPLEEPAAPAPVMQPAMAAASAPAPMAAPAPEEAAALPAGAEPEPVVTETMAEVYAKQGLLAQARAVYQQLIAQRPGDQRLQQRLAELTPRESGARRRRATAAQTGGVSARAFVAGVLTGRPVAVPPAPAAPAPMDAAFAAEPPGGAPTMPAADEASLASVFPDESGATPERAGSGAPGAGGGGAFSFDEFFGGRRPARPSTSRANPAGKPGGEDDFRSWLKGLNT